MSESNYISKFEIKVVRDRDHLVYCVNGEIVQTSDCNEYIETIKEITNELIDRYGEVDIVIKMR